MLLIVCGIISRLCLIGWRVIGIIRRRCSRGTFGTTLWRLLWRSPFGDALGTPLGPPVGRALGIHWGSSGDQPLGTLRGHLWDTAASWIQNLEAGNCMDKFVWVAGWISKFLVIRIDYSARNSKPCETHESPPPVPNSGQAAPLFLLQRSPVDNEVPIE